jgi:hypothetical protein
MSLIPTVTTPRVPYHVDRSAPGVVAIEKRFGDVNPNCILGILVIVMSIVLPAALAAISPLASVFIFVGSMFFPGVPIGLVNKKWRIEINNISHQMHVSHWHDFNKKKKQVNTIKFDDIKEIVAESTPDGTKHRLVILDQSSARHVLYESMNKAHANRFKDDFMDAIELAGLPGATVPQQGASPALTMRAPVVTPNLRQFAVPQLNNDLVPQDVTASLSQGGAIEAPVRHPEESREQVHARLAAIAKHKREVLLRVFAPGTGPADVPSTSPPTTTDEGTAAADAATAGKVDPACEYLRNKGEMYNIFDPCFATMEFIPQELAGLTKDFPKVVDGDAETQAGRVPKKKDGDGEEEVIIHRVDRRIEKELGVQKVRPTCMVCTIPLKGTNFICPTCETKYCIRCARALAERKESCWTCRKRIQLV